MEMELLHDFKNTNLEDLQGCLPLGSPINKKKLEIGAALLGFPRKWCQTREEMKGKKFPRFPLRIGSLEASFEQGKWKKKEKKGAATVARVAVDGEGRNEGEERRVVFL